MGRGITVSREHRIRLDDAEVVHDVTGFERCIAAQPEPVTEKLWGSIIHAHVNGREQNGRD